MANRRTRRAAFLCRLEGHWAPHGHLVCHRCLVERIRRQTAGLRAHDRCVVEAVAESYQRGQP